MILTEAGLEFRRDEKLLKRSLSHYLGNEWKINDWKEIFIDQIKSRFFSAEERQRRFSDFLERDH